MSDKEMRGHQQDPTPPRLARIPHWEVGVSKSQLIAGKVKLVVQAMQAAVAYTSGLTNASWRLDAFRPLQHLYSRRWARSSQAIFGNWTFSVPRSNWQLWPLQFDQQYLVTGLAALLSGLALACYARLDLSPFFSAVGVLPSLHQLSLHIDLTAGLLSNPAALVRSLPTIAASAFR
ncbi:hypothetical protein PLEOSDRAFT_160257 [Pleurotus ostreatus PC15]|uniref:Uncharacterized protein n=1 Tax=Pleurotus ostreatus (strain PC15) TaxID=1137138 RepID=A0A067NCN7_PLEO1|nr:hypothetical protein PLEOSDRAFT_160257 [Pleurotus ostreatus PC15]